jgi:Fuc2NAc and GlcNAc transferase
MVCFAALLFPFYADELTTMAIRLRNKENLAKPHRRHLYQILANEKGIAHWKITLFYGMVQLGIGTGALLLYAYGMLTVVLFLTICFLAFAFISRSIRRHTAVSL